MDRVDYQSMIIQDLINDQRDGKLNLNPWYQRRSVWTTPQKSYLINTLFERKPVPAIYIRHAIDLEKQKSIKEVVDGQQRCKAIISYCTDEFTARIASGERKSFSALSPEQREKFLLTPISVGYLLGSTDADVIDIFARINSVSKSLNTQEKRNAQFSGEFKQYCLKVSTENIPLWRNAEIFTPNSISRMEEVLFISDIIYNLINGLSDFRPSALDNLYKENEDDFPKASEIDKRLSRVLNALYEMPQETLKNTIFSRPPILFSLILCLDQKDGDINKGLEEKLYAIDAEFQDEDLVTEEVVAFREAASASTQRISSRRVRQDFISRRI